MLKTKKNESRNNYILVLISSIFLQSFSFLSIKISTLQVGWHIYFWLLMAILFIGLRVISWQILLKIAELSKVYPYASLVQILIFLYSIFIFHETVTLNHIVGLIIMLIGIFFISIEPAS